MSEQRTVQVNIIDSNGNITPYCHYFNNFSLLHNMESLWLSLHNQGDMFNLAAREKAREHIKVGRLGSVFFEFQDKTYITTEAQENRDKVYDGEINSMKKFGYYPKTI